MVDAGPRRRSVAVLVSAAFALPVAIMLVRAFADAWRAPAILPQRWGLRGVREALSGAALQGLATSTIVALAVTAIAIVLAWPAARVLGERRLRHPALPFLILALPLLVPSYATGTGLTEWFLRLGLVDTIPGLVLAHLVIVLPYVVVVLLGGFGPAVTRLEEMARSQGLTTLQRLRWVTLPSVRPTVAAAAMMSFVVSWSEYGASLAIGGGRPLLPLVLLPFVGSDPQVAATLSLLFLAPALAALVLAARAARSPM